jgi:molecular chaperone HtpG
LSRLGQQLADRVSAVRVSSRLTDSAACLVDEEGAPSSQLLQILRAMGQEPPAPRRILEVNAAHPLLERMQLRAQVSPEDPVLAEYALLLLDLALLAEGTAPADGAGFSTRLAAVMTRAMG